MDNKTKLLRRLIALCGVLLLVVGGAVARLFSLQIVNGEQYQLKAQRKLTGNLTVTASRGEILDRYGRPLVTNKTVLSLRIDYAYWDKEKQNQNILTLAQLVRADGKTVEDSLPISTTAPFTYTVAEDSAERDTLNDYLEKKKIATTLDAPALVRALRTLYEVDPALSDVDARTVIGVRYEMAKNDFSMFNSYIFAHDISLDLISKVKERHQEFAGVDIESEPVREYRTTYAAHILGRVGKMYAEEWKGQNGEQGYKDKPGYRMNSLVGKDGMELALEQYLHGTDGTRAVETNISGKVTGEANANQPKPGDNCILTIDIALQQATEEALAKRISEIPEATAGAAVVVQVGTGEVLAMASYPTYNLATFNQDYENLSKNPLTPMVNRATRGLYAPGSTFKPVTAAAALEEDVINTQTHFTCNHAMKFLNQTFKCTGTHGSINVETAIQKSCNIFFYNVGNLMGKKDPEALSTWAKAFGLGVKTGIELGESTGKVATPQGREKMLEDAPYLNSWQPGDFLQAAIGQSDNIFTPIQIANYVATLAGNGKHYQAHLLKSVKTYDYSQTVVDDTPNLLNTVEMQPSTIEAVKTGMHDVVAEGGSAAAAFRGYPIDLAGKSGTAQIKGKTDNGLFVAFAPYNNPEIAVCVVIEGGKSGGGGAAPVVRSILDAYFATGSAADNVPSEYTLLH